jgi:hypothetical protein
MGMIPKVAFLNVPERSSDYEFLLSNSKNIIVSDSDEVVGSKHRRGTSI